jgi:YVTN family beta-propeller protein
MPTSVPARLRLAAAVVVTTVASAAATPSFVTFESGQVRPLALSPDQTRLFAVNTPDNRLELFDVSPSGDLTHSGSVPVGLEPVAVAARSNGEVWVVNHLSDSVSIVDVAATPPRVIRTLLTCDEPRDIVFAGPGGTRAFITAARRGQNCVGAGGVAVDPMLTTEGVGRALVQVFDATNLGSSLGGTPITVIALFGDTPRALAVAPGGGTVYAAVFQSGNRTSALNEGLVCDGGAGAGACNVNGFSMPGGLPAPNPTSCLGTPQPETGMIVKFNGTNWVDTLGRNWNNGVRFSLPDFDVFAIDATLPAPTGTPWAGVGTILFNMVANPVSGKVYVSNTDANNLTRFEGDRTGSCSSSTVRGHLHEARITVLDGASVLPRHLNKHLEPYNFTPTVADKAKSLATPLEMATDGTTLYVAAFGSSQVGIFDTAQLEANTFTPSTASHVTVSGGGPSGLVLRGSRLYVFTRFDNGISVVDTGTKTEIAHLPVFNPEPASVVTGRPLLYDAVTTSANGEASCSACHIFGDFDSLAWDLGDPDIATLNNPNPVEFNFGQDPDFRALKGPMTTQSLRGMANHGPMHWRGDRTGGNDPGGDALDENAAFNKFNVAFPGLLGRSAQLTAAQMQAFTDFILEVTYPPNPIRNLNNSLTGSQSNGRDTYFGPITDTVRTCNGCHVLDPLAGFFGTDGDTSFENEPQVFKIPHLRNMYQKVGMFGMPAVPFLTPGNNANTGDQVRGFGFLHDGSVDTVFRFHGATVFSLTTTERQELEQFMFAFDSNLAPIVGQQITLTSTNTAIAGTRIDLLIQQAAASPVECEVVVKGNVGGVQRGWVRQPGGQFRSDVVAEPLLGDAALRGPPARRGRS